MPTISASLSSFQQVLDTHGLGAALLFLNRRVPHRFTAIYRLNGARLLRLGFVDKRGEACEETAEVPFENSFCALAVREGELLITDLSHDERLRDQPNPYGLGSYVGFPLASGPGQLHGTFCHYDTTSNPLSEEEFLFLERASAIIDRFCLQHGIWVGVPATS